MRKAVVLSDREWAEKKTSVLPLAWQKKVMRKWEEESKPREVEVMQAATGAKYSPSFRRAAWSVESYEGNMLVREVLGGLRNTRLPISANDADVVERAEFLAGECKISALQFAGAYMRENAMLVGGEWLEKGQLVERFGDGWRDEWVRPLYVEFRAMALGDGVPTPWDSKRRGGTVWGNISRMMCGGWWRRKLRAQHAKAVEGAAIRLGFVSRAREPYASDETVHRRARQNRRNAATLERTVMVNELGQEFTLADLSARSVSNRAIRRGELMTRIAGFEQIARDCGHDGLFLTLSCPSRMHKFGAVPGTSKVYENKKYDGTKPNEAQKYLVRVLARIRAKLARDGLPVYGFRISEPHHDGCPHWHLLLFTAGVSGVSERRALHRVAAIFRRYALEDSPDEAGAKKHRCKAIVIDPAKGTAAGYIAKYVAKNIDGMYIEKDLLGGDSMHVAARVEAWASAWRIRQFQQIGGAPVGVWRELRRIKEIEEGAPDAVKAAHRAVNRVEVEGEDVKPASWRAYVEAQGGVHVGRKYKIRLATEERAEEGAYGEALGAVVVGVRAWGEKAVMVCGRAGKQLIEWVIGSVRHVWKLAGGGGLRRAASPRTRVNNCTRVEPEKSSGRSWAEEFFNPAADVGWT